MPRAIQFPWKYKPELIALNPKPRTLAGFNLKVRRPAHRAFRQMSGVPRCSICVTLRVQVPNNQVLCRDIEGFMVQVPNNHIPTPRLC